MITKLEKLIFSAPIEVARAAWIEAVKIYREMRSQEFETVDADHGALLTNDGREIVWSQGKAWALRPEVHAERLAAAFEAAKKARQEPDPETKSVVGTESLSTMVCPKCGDSLQHTAVCPKCAAGKLGYRHRYTCVCGRVDLISKEAL